jgi:hypothetical protein
MRLARGGRVGHEVDAKQHAAHAPLAVGEAHQMAAAPAGWAPQLKVAPVRYHREGVARHRCRCRNQQNYHSRWYIVNTFKRGNMQISA